MTTAIQYLNEMANQMLFLPMRMEKMTPFRYTEEQKDNLRVSFPSLPLAEKISSESCMLLPTPPEPLNLLDLRLYFKEQFATQKDGWYADPFQSFARNEYLPAAQWLAIRRIAFPSARNNLWSQQLELLPPGAYIPSAVAAVYARLIYRVMRKKLIISTHSNRTSSMDADRNQVIVGPYGQQGLMISRGDDVAKRPTLMVEVALTL
jgi:hypothetical protein